VVGLDPGRDPHGLTVILIESGRYQPSLPLAFTIARFFDLTVDEMFG
jgi:DNA-binding XRE family transcriptional regulator